MTRTEIDTTTTPKIIAETLQTRHRPKLTPAEEYNIFQTWERTRSNRLEAAIMRQYKPTHEYILHKLSGRIQKIGGGHIVDRETISNTIWQEIFTQARNFDPNRGASYTTYVSRNIIPAIYRKLRMEIFPIRIKDNKIGNVIKALNGMADDKIQKITYLRQIYGDKITPQKMQWIEQLQQANNIQHSLDTPGKESDESDTNSSYIEKISYEQHEESCPIEHQEQQKAVEHVRHILDTGVTRGIFTERSANIYHNVMFAEKSESECAEQHKISRQRVNQIIRQMHGIMREELTKYNVTEY